ncbi:MAG TPA: hypothetical protein VF150_09940 [Thermoanaerobaculia bacterium]
MRRHAVPLLVTLSLLAPEAVQALGFEGWGLRAGTTSNPGSLVVGGELDLGYVVEPVRFVPSLELGLRSDTSVLSLGLPFLYTWGDRGEVRLYVGAGALVSLLDLEGRYDLEDEYEVAPLLTFGLELGGTLESMYLEATVSTGDAYATKFLVGWRY